MIAPLNPMPSIPAGTHPGAFGVNRRQHVHTGVDLYAPHGCPVKAMEKGVIVSIAPFTGPTINMPWWNDTMAVYIEGETGTFCYGEIQHLPTMRIGKKIQEGDVIGYVLTVLKKYKGRPMSMLHIELYDHGYTDVWGEWKIGTPKPEHLKDPTPYLEKLGPMSFIQSYGPIIYHDPYTDSVNLFEKSTVVKKPTPRKLNLSFNQEQILNFLIEKSTVVKKPTPRKLNLSFNQEQILNFLTYAKGVWFSPTFIAHRIKGELYHSAWSSPILLGLVKKGFVERSENGHYKITNKGRSLFMSNSKIGK